MVKQARDLPLEIKVIPISWGTKPEFRPQICKMEGYAPLSQYGQTGSWLILRVTQSITVLKDNRAFFVPLGKNHHLQNPSWQEKCS